MIVYFSSSSSGLTRGSTRKPGDYLGMDRRIKSDDDAVLVCRMSEPGTAWETKR